MYNVCSVEPLYEGGRRGEVEGKVILEGRMMNAEFFTTEITEFTERKSFKNSVFSVRSVVKSFNDQENRLALAETFLVLRGMPSVRFG